APDHRFFVCDRSDGKDALGSPISLVGRAANEKIGSKFVKVLLRPELSTIQVALLEQQKEFALLRLIQMIVTCGQGIYGKVLGIRGIVKFSVYLGSHCSSSLLYSPGIRASAARRWPSRRSASTRLRELFDGILREQ